MPLRFFLIALMLGGCGGPAVPNDVVFDTAAPGDVFEAPDIEECDAQNYRDLVGSDIASTTLDDSANLRVFGESDLVTQEYLPRRTNIVYDRNGLITRVYCG